MALVLVNSAADTSSLNQSLIPIQRPMALAPFNQHWQIITALSWPLLTRFHTKTCSVVSSHM